MLLIAQGLSEKLQNTSFIVLSLTRPGLEPTIYHIRGEQTNHYTTNAVPVTSKIKITTKIELPVNCNYCQSNKEYKQAAVGPESE
jgi:biotin synthase-like enzyme